MKLIVFAVFLVAASGFAMPTNTTTEEPGAVNEISALGRSGPDSNFADRKWLTHLLFKDYDKKLHPDQPNFEMKLTLIDFEVSTENNLLNSDVWLLQQWTDERFRWTEADFGGVTMLQVPHDQVWKPDVTLWNTKDQEHRMRCWNPNVLVYPNGMVLWIPSCELSSICNFNLTSSGELDWLQTCSMKFGSWTYDGWTMDANFMNGATGIDLESLNENNKFEIWSTSAVRNEKFYDCCKEPYLSLSFKMTVKATA